MKLFTAEEIANTRRYFESEKFPEITALVENISFKYFEIPEDREPLLPGFVMRMTGEKPEDGELYGASSGILRAHQPFAVGHEVYEFRVLRAHQGNRCAQALRWELAQVPTDERGAYLQMRLQFFQALVPYAKKDASYTEEDVDKFRQNIATLDYRLRELAARPQQSF